MLKKAIFLTAGVFLAAAIIYLSHSRSYPSVLLDDFEGEISGGSGGTVDYGSGGGSSVEVSGTNKIKQHGEQALEVKFDSVSGGYMWIARGYDLDVKGAAAWLAKPGSVNFKKHNAFSFCLYGANTGIKIAIDIVDNGWEYWRYLVEDNFTGWKEFVIPFSDFFARGDWQPEKADKNAELNYPIRAFQFEPRPQGKGTIYFDYVRLVSIRK